MSRDRDGYSLISQQLRERQTLLQSFFHFQHPLICKALNNKRSRVRIRIAFNPFLLLLFHSSFFFLILFYFLFVGRLWSIIPVGIGITLDLIETWIGQDRSSRILFPLSFMRVRPSFNLFMASLVIDFIHSFYRLSFHRVAVDWQRQRFDLAWQLLGPITASRMLFRIRPSQESLAGISSPIFRLGTNQQRH